MCKVLCIPWPLISTVLASHCIACTLKKKNTRKQKGKMVKSLAHLASTTMSESMDPKPAVSSTPAASPAPPEVECSSQGVHVRARVCMCVHVCMCLQVAGGIA